MTVGLALPHMSLCHFTYSVSQIPFVEDIVLGTEGLKEGGAGDFSTWVKDKRFDLGDVPLRIGGKIPEHSNYKLCDADLFTKLTNVK